MSIEIEYLCHTSAIIHIAGKSILCDPWLTDTAYCNSWWHYQDIDYDIQELARRCDALYISHQHPDHFDPKTLIQIDKSIRIFIGKFAGSSLPIKLKKLGFTNVREIECWNSFELFPGLEGVMMPSQHSIWDTHDSALLLMSAEGSVLNANDCVLLDSFIKKIKDYVPQLDVALLPYTPNFHYPLCFTSLSGTEKKTALHEMKRKDLDRFRQTAMMLKPRYVVPFSGPFILMGDDIFEYNQWRPTTLPHEAVEYLKQELPSVQGLVLEPGDILDTESGLIEICKNPINPDTFLDCLPALYLHRKSRVNELRSLESRPDSEFEPRLRSYLEEKISLASDLGLKFRFALSVTGDSAFEAVLDFENSKLHFNQTTDDYATKMTIPDHLMNLVAQHRAHFDDILFSFRCQFDQRSYQPHLWTVLRHESEEALHNWDPWELQK